MKTSALLSCLALAALPLTSSLASAQEHPEHPKKKPAAQTQPAKTETAPKPAEATHDHSHGAGHDHGHDHAAPAAGGEDAMMQAWMKAMTPGAQHQTLAGLEGTWDATVTVWMAPGAPPEVSKGVSKNSMVLGGRWLHQTYEGTFMGQPFSGVGYTGYDNAAGRFVSTWMDSASTGVMVTEGVMDASGKVLTATGSSTDPMTGKPAKARNVTTLVDADHHTMEMWMPTPEGKEMKGMEIQYIRRK